MKRCVPSESAIWVALGVSLSLACGSGDAGNRSSATAPKGAAGSRDFERWRPPARLRAGWGPGDGGLGADATVDSGSGDGGSEGGGVIGDPTGTTAVPIDAFLGSIGACAHIAQGVDAPSQSATAMSYAGLRNLRDDGNPNAVSDWISMHQSAGIRLSRPQ